MGNDDKTLDVIGALGQAPEGRCLSFDQIEELAKERAHEYRDDTPPGETPICAYCGAETKQTAYTHLPTNTSYPPCCSKIECIDQWEPINKAGA